MQPVVVIGAGMAGVCTALALASRGRSSILLEREPMALTGAGTHNEGKIHLGHTFAMDGSLATARLMQRGAFAFGALLRRWLGQELPPATRPYRYLVHRQSLMTPAELEARYAEMTLLARESGGPYFAQDPAAPARRLGGGELAAQYGPDIIAAFDTPEIAVDPRAVSAQLRARLASERLITLRTGLAVTTARRDDDAFILTLAGGETLRAASVVNASWEDRLRLDDAVGLPPPAHWSHRIKHCLYFDSFAESATLDPVTIVQGPFGDALPYTDGRLYLSSFPVGRRGFSTALEPPGWPRRLPPRETDEVRAGIVDALGELIPAVARLPQAAIAGARLQGALIYALGNRDVHDPASALHGRSGVGVFSAGGWHSLDPGKYTTAPLLAEEAALRAMA